MLDMTTKIKELETLNVTFTEFSSGLADVVARADNGNWRGFYAPFIPKIIVERIHENAVLPKYADDGDSGMDVYSPVDILLRPQQKELVPLGLKFQIPRHPLHELGYRWGMALRNRSGLTAKTELDAKLGTIDNRYRDELKVTVKNDTQRLFVPDHTYVDIDQQDSMSSTEVVTDVTMEEETDDVVHDLTGNVVNTHELYSLGLLDWCGIRIPKGTLLIRKGDRIAQLVFETVVRPLDIEEGTVSMEDSRGGGFGSTGVNG